MDSSFSVDSLAGQHKTISLSTKPQATLKTGDFQKVLSQKKSEQLVKTQTASQLDQASAAMKQAKEAFVQMEQFRTKIQAAYHDLQTFFPND